MFSYQLIWDLSVQLMHPLAFTLQIGYDNVNHIIIVYHSTYVINIAIFCKIFKYLSKIEHVLTRGQKSINENSDSKMQLQKCIF